MIAALENAVTVTRSRFAAACSLRYTFGLMRMFNCLSGCFAVAMHTPFDSIDRRHCRVCDAMRYAWAHHRFRWVFRKLPGGQGRCSNPPCLPLTFVNHVTLPARTSLVPMGLPFQLCRQPSLPFQLCRCQWASPSSCACSQWAFFQLCRQPMGLPFQLCRQPMGLPFQLCRQPMGLPGSAQSRS